MSVQNSSKLLAVFFYGAVIKLDEASVYDS